MDTSGNVWEWTLSPWTQDYEAQAKGVEASGAVSVAEAAEQASGDRVIRGGGFWIAAWDARSACRSRVLPQTAVVYLGFRVLLPAPRAGRS